MSVEAHGPTFPRGLADRYQPIRELGRGGMATVYLARDVKHSREVAVKLLHPSIASALGADRFLREIEIVAQMQHPNIVPLYDSGEVDGSLYYVMPHEPGSSLRKRLEGEGESPLGVDEVVRILRDVCDALAYAHERGVVHRDIKPDNVLVSGRRAMVADFGIAKGLTEATSRGAVTTAGVALGTPAYMAPEQIAAEPQIDRRADIYSLGVLAYELLTGKAPFAGRSYQSTLTAHLTESPAPIRALRPDVPPALEELVMKCLAKEPADRWQSVAEVIDRLEALGAGSGAQSSVWRPRRRAILAIAAASVAGAALAVALWPRNVAREWGVRIPWAEARIERLTDFPGSEVDASISANGQFVAFLADRDSVFDAFVAQVGSERFVNLTGGRLPEIFNEDVRNVGFSADAAHVWVRAGAISSPATVSIMPTLGGPMRPFLSTAVMAVWSPDGSRIAYHEATPGDPIFVVASDGSNPRRIYAAEPGIHCHYLTWSPDGRYLYFSKGIPPDEMDVWRVALDGRPAERITSHNSHVAYPAMLDERTLLYTATTADGAGPWLFATHVDERVPKRLSTTVEHYTSISASNDVPGQPRRLVATVSNPSLTLWTVPITDGVAAEAAASKIEVPTARSGGPRFTPDSAILYLASRGGANGLWRLASSGATEVWKATQGAVVAAPAVSPDGRTVCFPVQRGDRWTLHCTSADGTGGRTLADALDVRGAASFSPDGKWLAVAAKMGAGMRLFKVPIEGGDPVRLVDSVSSNPVWSPDGAFILYSATPRGRTVPVRAVTPEGRPYPIPPLTVDRLGESYRFLLGGKQLVVKLGGFRRQDFWLFDLATGSRRQITRLRPGESLVRFDVSPDGKRILFERLRENSDVVLIELPR
jgi:Tol biopolymer transport system component/tRNA A-37 threonylcarbamoyl transferase component Bud32